MFLEYIINYNDKDACQIHWNNLLDLQKMQGMKTKEQHLQI